MSSRGTSPLVTTTGPVSSAGRAARAQATARPVPGISSWSAGTASGATWARWATTAARSWRTTTTRCSGRRPRAAVTAWSRRLRPPMRWSTFGVVERIRVPLPAAMTMTAAGVVEATSPLLADAHGARTRGPRPHPMSPVRAERGRRGERRVTKRSRRPSGAASAGPLRPQGSNPGLKAPKACVLPLHQGGMPRPGSPAPRLRASVSRPVHPREPGRPARALLRARAARHDCAHGEQGEQADPDERE